MKEQIFATVKNGTVELKKSNGQHVKTICKNAVSAIVDEETVIVTMKNGETRLYKLDGQFIRSF